MNTYRVFFCIANSERDDVEAEDEIEMRHADVYSELFAELEEHEDFFGMVDENGVTLQCMYHADEDRYWFEIPVEDEGGSYGCFFDFDDAVDFVKMLPATFEIAKFPMLTFEPWSSDDDT